MDRCGLINTNQPNMISMGAKTKIKPPDYAELRSECNHLLPADWTDTGVLIELLSGVNNQSF